jgi:hypothetical protein
MERNMKELTHEGHTWFAESAGTYSVQDHDQMRVRFFCPDTHQEAFTHIPFRVETFATVPISVLMTALTEALTVLPHRRD